MKENAKEATPITTRIGSPFPSFLNLSTLTNSLSHNSTHSSTESTPSRTAETVTNFLHETISKLKNFLPKQHKVYAPDKFTAWEAILPFISSLRQVQTDINNEEIIVEMLGVYNSTGYVRILIKKRVDFKWIKKNTK